MRIGPVSLSLLVSTVLALAGNGLLSTFAALYIADASLSPWLGGAILSSYFAGLTVGAFLLPQTLRRIGSIRAFGAFASLLVASCLAHGLIAPGLVWLLLRFMVGLAMAGAYMTLESWFNADAPPAGRGRVMAGYLVALYLGTALGQLMLPFVIAEPLEPVVLAALVASLAALPVALTRVPQPEFPPRATLSTRSLVRAAPIGWLAASVSGFVSATIYANAPLELREAGATAGEISAAMSSFLIGGLAGQWPIGWLSDRLDRRAVLAGVTGMLAVLAAYGSTAAPASSLVGLLPTALFGALAFSIYPLGVAHTLDRIGAEQALPAAVQMLLASSLGAVAGPVVASGVRGALPNGSFYVVDAVLLVLLTGLIVVRLVRVAAVPQAAFQVLPRTTSAVYGLHRDLSGEMAVEDVPLPDGDLEGRAGAPAAGDRP